MALFPIKRDKLQRDFVTRVLGRDVTLYESKRDFLMLIDYTSLVDYGIAMRGGFEDAQLDRLFALAETAAQAMGKTFTFLDIGSYNALYSMVAARSAHAGPIVAYEPEALNRAQLHAQLFLNKLVRRIQVRPIGLSDHVGTAFLPWSETTDEGNRGGTGFAEPDTDRGDTVPVVPLDNEVSETDALIVAKIDVEGHELSVLNGARQTLTQNACLVQIECFPESGNRDSLRAIMGELGFREIGEIHVDLYFTNIDAKILKT